MRTFKKFLEDMGEHMGSAELLQRIVQQHGARFKSFLKKMIVTGELEDDPELLTDIKQLYKSLNSSSDQFPPTERTQKDFDVVTRPPADSGGGIGSGGDQ